MKYVLILIYAHTTMQVDFRDKATCEFAIQEINKQSRPSMRIDGYMVCAQGFVLERIMIREQRYKEKAIKVLGALYWSYGNGVHVDADNIKLIIDLMNDAYAEGRLTDKDISSPIWWKFWRKK